ncbi:MAG: Molybdopterin or thiamine biosynthesis adenylyltransferase [Candidatus Methanocomedens sp.]|nr:MAG: Molybdopterin or thiamine biosynthesis adenylyltransferase [ANME-2 cluster archaeon]
MDKNSLINKIKKLGLNTKEEYMAEAFSRNIGLLTQAEQDKLANAKLAIPGMGGVGGVHLITMTRTGVGKFHLADFDTYDPVNINRQFGARIPDFGRPKMEVMKEQALSINPYLEIKEFPKGISGSNIDDFLEGVQVVIDGLDFFAFDIRRLLFNRAREKGVYVITAGPLGFSSAMLIFSPHEGMSFDEYFNIVEGMEPQDQYLSFALGLAPRATHIKYMDLSRVDLESKAGPSLNIACQICSGMAATEAVRIILNKGKVKPVPYFFQFDPFLQKYRKGKLLMGNRNPIQRIKMAVVKHILRKKHRS